MGVGLVARMATEMQKTACFVGFSRFFNLVWDQEVAGSNPVAPNASDLWKTREKRKGASSVRITENA